MSESSGPFPDLPPEVWARLEQILNRFEDAWQRGERPALEDYLAEVDAERAALLRELVHIDLELRRRAGEPAHSEDYLARFPELSEDTEVIAALSAPPCGTPAECKPGPAGETPRGLHDLHTAVTRTLTRRPDTDGPDDDEPRPPPRAGPQGLPQVPGYEILSELGRGGMGVVYKARHVALNRLVALKVLRAGAQASSEEVARFQREAQAVARLRHPNIVQIHDVGSRGGQPHFTMEFIEGGSLAQKLAGVPQPARQAAALVQTLARAVDVAHQNGVIHRDLKPANILLTADQTPKVSDFGLAKRVEVGDGLTESGITLGTPSYTAPEQAQGKVREIGPAADVYSLGAILYEMLSGRPPFRAETSALTVMQVIADDPVPPARLNPKVPRDLETVCLQCLHKNPARRYASARALADDLRRFQNGEPVSARRTPAWERAVKWARRRPAAASLVALIGLIFLGLAAATALLTAANQREREALEQAIRAQRDAEQKEREAAKARQAAEENERQARREREEARRKGQTTKEVASFLTELFQTSDPIGLHGLGLRSGRQKGGDLTARQLLDLGTRRVRAQVKDPAVKAAMLDTLGNVYRSLGEFAKAEPMLKEGLQIREEKLGKDHEDTASSLHHLAWLRHDQGQYREAETLYRRALTIREKVLGPRHLATAATLFNLAYLLSYQDGIPTPARLDEAESLLRRVLDIRREQLPSDHRDLGWARVALAVVLYGRGNRDAEAQKHMVEGIRILGRGENQDAVSATFLKYFAATRARAAKRYAEAEKLYREVVAVTGNLLGEEHPLLAILLGDLAGMLRERGDLPGAEQAIRKALAIGRRCPLGGHPLMIRALLDLGDYERKRGKPAEAEKLYAEALQIARTFQRAELCPVARSRLAEALRDQGRYKEADSLANAP
jgi:tetratricopeptide (TPR) repeat protein